MVLAMMTMMGFMVVDRYFYSKQQNENKKVVAEKLGIDAETDVAELQKKKTLGMKIAEGALIQSA